MTQILTIGRQKFVVVPEREFLRLKKRAGEEEVRPALAEKVMRELKAYRKSRKGVKWADVQRELGL